MQHLALRIVAIVALLLAGSFAAINGGVVRAQDASPVASPVTMMELAPGITAEVLAAAPSAGAPGMTMYVARFVFQPGAEIFPHSHPGTTVLGVYSGTFGWTLVEGTAHVIRGAGSGATGPVEDITELGTEVILEPGDSIYYESDVVHMARGAGDTETVILGSLLLEEMQPLLSPVGEATPETT